MKALIFPKSLRSAIEPLIGALISLATAVLQFALVLSAMDGALLLMFAQAFIVVESFINSDHVPHDVCVDVE